MKIYTMQKAGHDITAPLRATSEYMPGGAYHGLVMHLGFMPWIWCLERLSDYRNCWFNDELWAAWWVLDVPAERLLWLSLDAQCKNVAPITSWFAAGPEEIRARGETPEAILPAPIAKEWVVRRLAFGSQAAIQRRST